MRRSDRGSVSNIFEKRIVTGDLFRRAISSPTEISNFASLDLCRPLDLSCPPKSSNTWTEADDQVAIDDVSLVADAYHVGISLLG
jgi:hypothetical protein